MIKQNQIAQTGAGIAIDYAATSTRTTPMISIENNQLTDIASQALSGDAAATTIATAIWVRNATVVHIVGNTILGLATAMPAALSRIAIMVWDSDGALISGNDVSDIGPAGSFTGLTTGVAVLASFGGIHIGDNLIRRFSATATPPAADTGEWIPVLVLGTLPSAMTRPPFIAASNLENFRTSTAARTDAVTTTLNTIFKIDPKRIKVMAAPALLTTERVVVSGNQLEGFGSAPISFVSGALDCIFSENHCLLATPDSQLQSSADVVLAANTVIAASNRIVGGRIALAITVPKGTASPVLGNLTRGSITVDESPLAVPWSTMNVSGI